MTVTKNIEGTTATLTIAGRVDTQTSGNLESAIKGITPDITKLVLDMEGLEYISSSGLRVILMAQKMMNKQGEMILTNVKAEIYEIFDITGFSDILTIEQ